MCLAILRPAGVDIPAENLKQGWISNPDGGGYGFVSGNKCVTRKGFGKWKDMQEALTADLKQHTNSPFLIHFRICTLGTKDITNTHPFEIEGGLLIHNGTLTGTGASYGSGKSDTALFAESFSKDLSFDFVHKNKKELGDSVSGSKFALLYDDKRFSIINEDDGHWEAGVWYSNRGYEARSHYSHWSLHGELDD